MKRNPRPGNCEALRDRLPPSALMIEDLDPEAVHHPSGTLRTTVVLEDRSGATLLLSPDDVPKVLEVAEEILRPLQIDVADIDDWFRMTCAINSRDNATATMLALYLAWHHPEEGVPSDIKAALEEHNRACITFGIDRRFPYATTVVCAEYEDPFGPMSDASTTARQPAQGKASERNKLADQSTQAEPAWMGEVAAHCVARALRNLGGVSPDSLAVDPRSKGEAVQPKPSTIVRIKGDYNATYVLKNTVCCSYEITPRATTSWFSRPRLRTVRPPARQGGGRRRPPSCGCYGGCSSGALG